MWAEGSMLRTGVRALNENGVWESFREKQREIRGRQVLVKCVQKMDQQGQGSEGGKRGAERQVWKQVQLCEGGTEKMPQVLGHCGPRSTGSGWWSQ